MSNLFSRFVSRFVNEAYNEDLKTFKKYYRARDEETGRTIDNLRQQLKELDAKETQSLQVKGELAKFIIEVRFALERLDDQAKAKEEQINLVIAFCNQLEARLDKLEGNKKRKKNGRT